MAHSFSSAPCATTGSMLRRGMAMDQIVAGRSPTRFRWISGRRNDDGARRGGVRVRLRGGLQLGVRTDRADGPGAVGDRLAGRATGAATMILEAVAWALMYLWLVICVGMLLMVFTG